MFKKIVFIYLMATVCIGAGVGEIIDRYESPEVKELKQHFPWINENVYNIINKNCKVYGLEVVLVCSVIQYESGMYCKNNLEWMSRVISYAGAIGICQIMPLHVKNPEDLKYRAINIDRGCWYLSKCIKKAKNCGYKKIYAEACRMYNSGLHAKRSNYRGWAYVYRIQNIYEKTNKHMVNNNIYLVAQI